jgi:DNA-binding transcriptional ArsR family regulator
VGELVQELEASQPTISKHLKVLREADLVSMRAQGQKRYYALNPKPLAGIASWLETFDVGPARTAGAAEASPAPVPDARLRAARILDAPDSLAAAAPPAAAAPAGTAAAQPAAAALAGRPAASPLSAAVVIPVGPPVEDKMPQQLGRTVGRAATKAADLLASLPKFGRRK